MVAMLSRLPGLKLDHISASCRYRRTYSRDENPTCLLLEINGCGTGICRLNRHNLQNAHDEGENRCLRVGLPKLSLRLLEISAALFSARNLVGRL
jgi:hypothetical protein